MDVDEIGIRDDYDTVHQPMRPTRDEVYYFHMVVFQVGNTLFRVPRNAFNVPGTIFEAMFTLPPTEDNDQAEGLTDENPIVLNVDEDYFRGFLRILCGSRVQNVTSEDWLGALDLATMWTFDDVRREAIRSLDEWTKSQSLKQVILTAKKYNIVNWLKVAYTQLVEYWATAVFDELTNPPAIDWETIAKLLHIKNLQAASGYRGQYLAYFGGCKNCGAGRVCCGVVSSVVEKIFEAEFEGMGDARLEDPPLPGGSGISPADMAGKKKKKKKLPPADIP